MQSKETNDHEKCYHCGEPCQADAVSFEDHVFCCTGCQSVYQILETNGLCQYYDLDKNAGVNPTKSIQSGKWQFLDDDDIVQKLTGFRSATLAIVSFHVPNMHCSSCIYLLENMSKLVPGVLSSEVNFLKKEITIKYNPARISLRKVVEAMASVGYPPMISLNDAEAHKDRKYDKTLIYKIGIAGFCFGNIMILSLPEYFDFKKLLSADFIHLFRYLNVALILPVLFYSASDYFRSAWNAVKHMRANMDFALSVGIGGLALQSFYDVLSGSGSGYFDSMSGLIFLLLVGRFIQQRTFQALSFDRDYRSYFPLAITRIKGSTEKSINVNDLMPDDEILVHHQELIPADALLGDKEAWIDYSFVTGESQPVRCHAGELIYAGGRNQGPRIKLRVVNAVSQSYLTRLWNDKAFEKEEETGLNKWSARLANGFTAAVLAVAAGTAIYWKINNPALMLRAVTSVLIIACPCVMALSIPFTFGQIMRILGKNGLYLKNGPSIEKLAGITSIVFDKTGTLTQTEELVTSDMENMSGEERSILSAAIAQSLHPVSRALKTSLNLDHDFPITNWEETVGQGITAYVGGNEIKVGKSGFVNSNSDGFPAQAEDKTWVSINGALKGGFRLALGLREDAGQLINTLGKRFSLFLLTGDNDRQRKDLQKYFQPEQLYFNQSPANKLDFVKAIQAKGQKVMMIGDGLNDAGALKASDFGITVTGDINSFTPASDAILDSRYLASLPKYAGLARSTRSIVFGALYFSLAYNLFGLSFAVQGHLQPWVAAILMPLSSITVVVYTRLATQMAARKNELK